MALVLALALGVGLGPWTARSVDAATSTRKPTIVRRYKPGQDRRPQTANYDAYKAAGLALMRQFPPDRYFIVGVGRSPTKIVSFLKSISLTREPKSDDVSPLAVSLPASGAKNMPVEADVAEYFRHFDTFLPADVKAGKRQIVLIDLLATGASVNTMASLLRRYLAERKVSTSVVKAGFAQKVRTWGAPSYSRSLAGFIIFDYDAFGAPTDSDGGNVAEYAQHQIGRYSPGRVEDLRPNLAHVDFRVRLADDVAGDADLDRILSTEFASLTRAPLTPAEQRAQDAKIAARAKLAQERAAARAKERATIAKQKAAEKAKLAAQKQKAAEKAKLAAQKQKAAEQAKLARQREAKKAAEKAARAQVAAAARARTAEAKKLAASGVTLKRSAWGVTLARGTAAMKVVPYSITMKVKKQVVDHAIFAGTQYADLRAGTLDLLARHDPAKHTFVGVGRSSSAVVAFLDNLGLAPGYLPLDGIKDDLAELPNLGNEYNAVIAQFLVPAVKAGTDVVLFQTSDTGQSLPVIQRLAQIYLRSQGSTAKVEVVAFSSSTTSSSGRGKGIISLARRPGLAELGGDLQRAIGVYGFHQVGKRDAAPLASVRTEYQDFKARLAKIMKNDPVLHDALDAPR